MDPADRALSVSDAARLLGVSEQRVRAMLAEEVLGGAKVGRQWLLDRDEVERLAHQGRASGRPFARRTAWALLLALQGRRPKWVEPWVWSRVRRTEPRRVRELLPRLRRRAEIRKYRAHPGVIEALSQSPRIVVSGARAAGKHGLDLASPEEFEGYVREKDLAAVVRRWRLKPDERANVVLRIVGEPWPFEPGERIAPQAVVAVDLLESSDPRSRREGEELLEGLNQK
jgi:excisionase family DNA binding protein